MDEIEEVQQLNMISNLPLLFANGYPTALEKITESQLENFIPFMVQCSLGHINLQGKMDYSEPEWWPENVAYTIPFTKPKKFTGNWLEKMKEIVLICYQFHRSVFLLRFCNDLAAYEHASLRFINNYNSTTSLFDRRSNKLLVTFRNENMSYDQPQRIRKSLLQQKSKLTSQQQQMVEPAPFDIYLCDNCDAELYSEEAIVEHEKTCNLDDDVIICDSPEPEAEPEDNQLNLSSNTTENNELRKCFLLNFNLQCREGGNQQKASTDPTVVASSSAATKDLNTSGPSMDKLKRLPRRNRAVHSLSRCPTIALSSPAGQLLIKTSKTLMTKDYLMERLDRMERFCFAPTLAKGANKPKFLEKKYTAPITHCTFKKPPDYTIHTYMFPRRQFSQRQRTEHFMFLNSLLIKRCRPISVRLRKITEKEMTKRKRTKYSNKLNIKLTRDTSRSSNWKISSPSTQIIVDTIDLCSSGEENEDIQPRKMRRGNTPDSSSSSSRSSLGGNSHNKSQLQVIKRFPHRLNSEITLTPIPREPLNGGYSINSRHSMPMLGSSSSTVVAAATSTTHSKSHTHSKPILNGQHYPHRAVKIENGTIPLSPSPLPSLSPLKRYEGNILLSPTQTQNGTIQTVAAGAVPPGIIATKPLQPSVFIFSNYTTTPISINSFLSTPSATHAGTATVVTAGVNNNHNNNFINNNNNNNDLIVSSSYQNEENHHEASSRTKKKNSDWYPASIAANSISISSSNSKAVSVGAGGSSGGSDRSSRSLPLMSFGSTSRVISIDLTS